MKVDRSSFDEIYSLLLRSKWDRPKATWRNLCAPEWETGQFYCGYALVNNGQLVGFLSVIFAQRKKKDGEILNTCGLSTWFVEDNYRSESLKLLEPVLALKDYLLINLTNTQRAYEISKALGFADFERHEICIFPRIDLIGLFCRSKISISHKEDEVIEILNESDLLLYKDHKTYNYRHIVLHFNNQSGEYCYVVYKRVHRKRLPAIRIDYISNKDLFARFLGKITLEIFNQRPFLFLIVDSRQIAPHRIFFSIKSKLKVPRNYRPDRNGSVPTDDNLYSEFVLLDM